MNRKSFIQLTAMCGGSILASNFVARDNNSQATDNFQATAKSNWVMPDESAPHKCTWMSFGASREIWGQKLLAGVQDNLATIAKTIARYEPVNMLFRQSDYEIAARKCGKSVNLIVSPLDDLWMRDIGPVFVKNSLGKVGGVDFNFNGWGKKQKYSYDAKVANFVVKKAGVQQIATKLVLEGGGIEVDGSGTAIITESCVLNQNRNPGVSKSECEIQLKALLGLRKIIWLPGIKGKDITDGHTDFYARFATPGIVVAGYDTDPSSFDYAVTKKHLAILKAATDANGRKLEVITMEGPSSVRPKFESKDFAAGYINFYVVNNAVIAPEFGDKNMDANAKSILKELFPDREIVQLNIDAIAAGGGGIHCTTQQQPQFT